MSTFDLLESTRGDSMRAFAEGTLEKTFRLSMSEEMTIRAYTFADGLTIRFDTGTYQRRIDRCLESYSRHHGQPVSVSETVVKR